MHANKWMEIVSYEELMLVCEVLSDIAGFIVHFTIQSRNCLIKYKAHRMELPDIIEDVSKGYKWNLYSWGIKI